jgi:hypothetical protein
VIRHLAAEHPDALFVDQARLMAGTPGYFNHPCQFTVAGSAPFVENLLPTLISSFDAT